MITKKALAKYEILVFWEKHGLQATIDAFHKKRRILFDWQKKFNEGGKILETLNEKRTTPHIPRLQISERCLRQFKVAEDAGYLWSRMSVLIQEMCPAELSAVVMTRDPVEGDNYFGMEVTYGACEAIVSGKVQGDLYLLNRATGDILSAETGTKNFSIRYEPFIDWKVDNKVKLPVLEQERKKFAASQKLIASIYDLGMFIERHFRTPQDIELVVSRGEIIVTQSRPITTG